MTETSRRASSGSGAERWARALERLFPDAFTLALLITVGVFVLACLATPSTPLEVLGGWRDGFWSFLEFSMQMVLILVTGQALAMAPPVERLLERLVLVPKTLSSGVVLVTFCAMVSGWINWGFGLVVGAILARRVADELSSTLGEERIDRGLLAAAGYTAMTFWHGGLSGSAPLAVATAGHNLSEEYGVIPLQETTFTWYNIALILVMLPTVPLFLGWLARRMPVLGEPAPVSGGSSRLFSGGAPRLFERVLAYLLSGLGLGAWVLSSFDLGLNGVNFVFLFLGLALHGSPQRYGRAVEQAMSGVSGIVLQFPFYAGIAGMAASSGLIGSISEGFVRLAVEVEALTGFQPFLILVFWSAGLVNLFVPSGGGQWIVQGPIVLAAAERLGAPLGPTVMAVAYGDQWTNLLQPFWALPLLAITGLKPYQLLRASSLLLILVGLAIIVLLGIVSATSSL